VSSPLATHVLERLLRLQMYARPSVGMATRHQMNNVMTMALLMGTAVLITVSLKPTTIAFSMQITEAFVKNVETPFENLPKLVMMGT